MQIIRGVENYKLTEGCVATVGNFDGVHLGHQNILTRIKKLAHDKNLTSVVVIFEPQPNEYFDDECFLGRLFSLREKTQTFRNYSIDVVLVIPFHRQFAKLTAKQFVKTILVERLAVKHLVIGDDFHFGSEREGHFFYLQKAGKQFGFTVEASQTISVDGRRVDSTWVRQALQAGDLTTVEKLLGHHYYMCGHVVYGDRRGHQLGFPTANVRLKHMRLPLRGVFAVKVLGINEQPILGVANVGCRPTVDGEHAILEVNLFDFDQDIYGHIIHVIFLEKLRDERLFSALDALKHQMKRDAAQAKEFFSSIKEK